MTKGYKIFSLKLARLLCEQGFHMIGTVPNAKKPWLDAFVFEDTEKLRQAVEAYKGASLNGGA